jgi:transposase-like protein
MISYGTKIKEKAVALRKKGKSFSQIAKTLKIGKSTVGFWFKNVIAKSKVKTSVQKKIVKTK